MPLSLLFGPEALQYRLHDSGAMAAIVDASAVATVAGLRAACPQLRYLIAIDVAIDGAHAWSALLARAADRFTPVATRAEDPALLIDTSGTTGPPKGPLMPQAARIGNLPGLVASQNWFPQPGDVFRWPAYWV